MRDRRKRNIIIGSLCCLLVFMATGYAFLKQVLNINGTASLTGDWKIRISDISVHEVVGTASNIEGKLSYTDTEATFGVNLVKPGDKIVYKVTVVNEGSIDAVLSIDSTASAHKDIKFTNTLTSGEILYGSGSANGTTKLSQKEFYVTAEFSESATDVISGEISEYKIQLTYTQYDGNELYDPTNIATDNGVFKVTTDGTIVDYNEELGTHVSIPAEIDGEPVTAIATSAFRDSEVITTYNYDLKVAMTAEGVPSFAVLFDESQRDEVLTKTEEMGFGHLTLYSVDDTNIPGLADDEMYGYFYLETLGQVAPILPTDEGFLGEKITKTNLGSLKIKSLDLSNAINLETIGDYAFSNVTEDTAPSEYSSVATGLTSLTFGNNTNTITVGKGAFFGAQLPELKLYENSIKTSLTNEDIADIYGDEEMNIAAMLLLMMGLDRGSETDPSKYLPFGNSKIGTLLIQSTGMKIKDEIYLSFPGILSINKLYIDEGITSLDDGSFVNSEINKVVLPNTLEKISAKMFGGTTIGEISIPASVTVLDAMAFFNANLNNFTIPSTVKTFNTGCLANMTVANEVTIYANISNVSENTKNMRAKVLNISPTVNSEIDSFAFTGSTIDVVNISSKITSVGTSAFRDLPSTSVVNIDRPSTNPFGNYFGAATVNYIG